MSIVSDDSVNDINSHNPSKINRNQLNVIYHILVWSMSSLFLGSLLSYSTCLPCQVGLTLQSTVSVIGSFSWFRTLIYFGKHLTCLETSEHKLSMAAGPRHLLTISKYSLMSWVVCTGQWFHIDHFLIRGGFKQYKRKGEYHSCYHTMHFLKSNQYFHHKTPLLFVKNTLKVKWGNNSWFNRSRLNLNH